MVWLRRLLESGADLLNCIGMGRNSEQSRARAVQQKRRQQVAEALTHRPEGKSLLRIGPSWTL